MLVGNHEIYINQQMADLLDVIHKRNDKKWDTVIIVDGEEGGGKSTLVKTLCYYYSVKYGVPFSNENIHFYPDRMLEYAKKTRKNIIVWDEAAFGGLSSEWQGKIQKRIIKMLMTARKYQHLYFFIVPSFFYLKDYIAKSRPRGLINVYSDDMISRGDYRVFSRGQLRFIYNHYRKSETYGKHHSFIGSWTHKNTDKIVHEALYDKNKDEAIEYFANLEADKPDKLNLLRYNIASKLPMDKAMEIGQVSQKTIYNWQKLVEKPGFNVI